MKILQLWSDENWGDDGTLLSVIVMVVGCGSGSGAVAGGTSSASGKVDHYQL